MANGALLGFLTVLAMVCYVLSESPGDCNFDKDFCNWVNDPLNDFDWLRRSERSPTLFTGPSSDHTSGKGFYIYNNANDKVNVHKTGEKARLISPLMRGPKCMTFYYNMYGKYMSCFLVYIKVENSTQYLAWIKSGNRGDRWVQAQVFINETRSYQVILEVIQNWSWSGLGAIDDIFFHNGSCEKNEDSFYVSKKYGTSVLYKVGTMPQYGDWKNQFSFSARKTTGNLQEPMYFIYPSSSYGDPLITRRLYLKPLRFPLDFFYDSAGVNTSSVFYVLQRGSSMSEQISTVNSSYEHCCNLQGIESFNEVPVEVENPNCSEGWIGIRNWCFYFNIEEVRTWDSARKKCRSLGGDLVIIDTLEKLANLTTRMLEKITLGVYPYYVGLRDTVTNVTQQVNWINGMPVDNRFWKEGQPQVSGDAKCGVLTKDANQLLLQVCSTLSGFICESKGNNIASNLPVKSSSASSMASLAVDNIPDTCYYSHKSSNPWLRIRLPKTKYIHRVQITNYKGCCNIPYASMEVIVEQTSDADIALSRQCGKDQPFGGDVLSREFTCRPPISGNRLFFRLHGDNITLVLCHVSVAAFDSVDEAKGVHRQIWYKLINTQGMSSIRENVAFNSVPHGATLSRDFGSQFEVADNYGEMLTSFLQVPLSGNYTFHISCGDECELWIKEYHENGLLLGKGSINSDVGQLLVRIQKWASYNDSLGCVSATTAQKIYLTKCRIYEMKFYVKEGSRFQCLAVGMTTPNGIIEQPIKNKHLFWMQPGQRILTFTVLGPTVLEADLGETVSIKARYTFCCHGIHCPNCSLKVEFRVFDNVYDVSRSLKATCEEHLFSVQLDAVVQPGIHKMEIIYAFPGTSKEDRSQRTVGQINVRVALLQNETFTKGFGKWKPTDSQPGWKTGNSSKELFAFIDGPYSSNLQSPVLPWKQFYSQVGLCLEFSYLMPKLNPATLKVFLNISGSESQLLLWTLSGFHGDKWHRARVSWPARENSVIVIRGESSVSNALSVAIDTVTITTAACEVHPSYAASGFSCNKDEFQCTNGRCISSNHRCDNDFNCLDNSDEIGCKCLVNELTCPSGKCVESRKLCDGKEDCDDGLDEKRCGRRCGVSRFACPEGKCLSFNSTCSKSAVTEEHCLDKSNIPSVCGTSPCPLDKLNCKEKASEEKKKCKYSFRGLCTFDNGLCGLKHDNATDLRWTIGTSSTPSYHTGPKFDHSTWDQQGSYIFIEASKRLVGDKARISSDWMSPGSSACLQFWYHMYGIHIGELNVITKTSNGKESIVWSRTGNQGDKWLFGQVGINITGEFQFIIEGLRGPGSKGDIAFDDITLLEGYCVKVLDPVSPDCAFEEDSCQWQNDGYWLIQDVKDSHIGHNGDRGRYLELKDKTSGQLHSITSADLQNSTWSCLRFWYFIGLGYLANLRVGVVGNGYGSLWSTTKSSDGWSYVQVPFNKGNSSYKVVIQGSSTGPVVAVDEISFSEVPCHHIPHSTYKGFIPPPVPKCIQSLGMQNFKIPNSRITASSYYRDRTAPWRGRLFLADHYSSTIYTGGWCTLRSNPWLMVDLGQDMYVTMVATQGKQELDFWVKNYNLSYAKQGDIYLQKYYKNGKPRKFIGNSDRHTPVYNHLDPVIVARYITIYPSAYHRFPCLRVDYFGCPVEKKHNAPKCDLSLGIQRGRIPDASITASSSLGSPHRARLYTVEEGGKLGAWVPEGGDNKPWLQIDFGTIVIVTKIATQGRHGNFGINDHFVTSYSVSYSQAGISFDWYRTNGTVKVYQANRDRAAVVYNTIDPSLIGRYVRIHPISWRIRPAIRLDMYGCVAVESDIAKIQNIGCFKDSTPAAIPSLENIDEVLEGNYYERSGAILRCAEAAYKRGFDVFAIQNGKCLSSSTASMSFAKYGNTTACGIHGRGGVLANEVYQITRNCEKDNELCTWKEGQNSSYSLESRNKGNVTREIKDNIIRANQGDIPSSYFEETVVHFLNGAQMTSQIMFHSTTSFSLCFWTKCTHPGIFIALEVSGKPSIQITQGNCKFKISILRSTGTADQCICDDRWHHVCFTWKSQGGVWEMYLDGRLRSFGRWLSGLKKLPALDNLIVSYHSSYSNASYKQLQLTAINVWSSISSPQEVLRMSYGCGGNGLHGDVISWNKLLTTMTGNYSLSNNSSCFFEKGGIFLNSSLSTTIVSPWFDRSNQEYGKCMRFRYLIQGHGSSVQIFQSVFGDEMGKKRIWMDENRMKAVWNYGQISIAAVSTSQIAVQAHFIKKSSEFVVIGGLYFTDGYCKTLPSRADEACNVLLTNSSGTITSPLYPAYYPNKSSCKWTISVPKGNIIILSSLIFGLEPHLRCKKDYLAVYDGTPYASSMIGRYCGEAFPSRIESSSHIMGLVFRSNSHVTRKGFKFTYETKAQTEDMSCGKNQDVCPTSCQCFQSSGNTKRLVVQGDSLLSVPRNIPKQSAVIFFQQNRIYQLKKDDFRSLPSLEYVDISNNVLLRVEDKTFKDLPKIQDIKMSTNFISSLSSNVFDGLSSLRLLDLSENIIKNIESDTFRTLQNLTVLSLRSNHIARLHPDIFKNITNLKYLYLQDNRIEALPDGIFRNLKNLKVLYLNDNKIKKISFGTFRGLVSLQTLFLQNNKFSFVTPETFDQLKNLKILKLDHFTLCCYAVKAIPGVDCEAPVDEFSSCDDLMKNKGLQICIWVLGIFAFLGNIGVIIWRVLFKEENKVHSYLLTNLAISDFLMGVYLLIIAIKDAQWQGEYFKKDYEWRNGLLCQLTGALSMLSSEVSVLMLTLITADRFVSIVFAMKFGKLSYKKAVTMCVIIWSFGLLMSLLPLTGMTYFHDKQRNMGFYGRSSVCLPLQLSSSRPAGWEYSVSFFIAMNFISFVFIFIAYIMMFWTVKKASNAARSTNAKKEAAMARKLLFIVLTDFCCWMPVILMGIFSLTGDFHDPQGLAYVWIAVFVLPVNSSINPILYTFSNANVKKKLIDYGKTISISYANYNSMITLSTVRDNQDGSSTTDPHHEKTATKRPKGLSILNKKIDIEPLVEKRKIKLVEFCDIFTSIKPKGKAYVTCWDETSQSVGLLKIFAAGKHDEWMKEVNVLNRINKGRDHDNLMNYRWHSKADSLEIDRNNIDIAGMPLSQNCRVICFDFAAASSKSLARFLGETGFNANIESLFILSVDVLKAVEYLHQHEVCHGDINSHTIVIGKFRRIPPIKAFVGGFDKASTVKSGTKADEAYKSDIIQVGKIIKQMLDSCGYTEDFEQIGVAIDMCFEESFIWKRRAKEIRCRLEQIWISSNEWDSCV